MKFLLTCSRVATPIMCSFVREHLLAHSPIDPYHHGMLTSLYLDLVLPLSFPYPIYLSHETSSTLALNVFRILYNSYEPQEPALSPITQIHRICTMYHFPHVLSKSLFLSILRRHFTQYLAPLFRMVLESRSFLSPPSIRFSTEVFEI